MRSSSLVLVLGGAASVVVAKSPFAVSLERNLMLKSERHLTTNIRVSISPVSISGQTSKYVLAYTGTLPRVTNTGEGRSEYKQLLWPRRSARART